MDFFTDELDYCIANDWNFDFDTHEKTIVGEAEYIIKYKYMKGYIDDAEATPYFEVLSRAVDECLDCLPLENSVDLIVTTIPALETEQQKLSWYMADYAGRKLNAEFMALTLLHRKPETKNLPVSAKIKMWDSIYTSPDGLKYKYELSGKTVLVIDDLYQSGASMWSLAKHLKERGAREVMGLVAVKSQRDSDNI